MPHILHVLSRGVDKRKIFLNKQDYFRFVHDLFEFNDEAPADLSSYRFKSSVIARPKIGKAQKERQPRKLLVDIHAFCLMPNHYHLLLSPRSEKSISQFMKKLNMGYSRYFNEKYERSGTLFEGRYKRVLVTSEPHFIHLPYYIHLNPLDLISPEWRGRELKNPKKAMRFLESYRWSSHLDYAGKKNFPSVTQREFLSGVFDGAENYKRSISQWLKSLSLVQIKDIALE